MFSTSPPCRLCPASTGLSSNVPAHVAASSGSPSSQPGLRFSSTRLPLERTGPKAACSCRTRVYQQPRSVCADGHETILHMNLIYWWIPVRSLHCIKDNMMKTRTNAILWSSLRNCLSIFSRTLLVIFLCGRVLIRRCHCCGKSYFSLMLLLEQVDKNDHGHTQAG